MPRRHARAGAVLAVVLAAAAAGCGREPRAAGGRAAPAASHDSVPPAGVAAAEAEVREAFLASREALRRLDVEAYLEGYAAGPGLVVVDPAGEFAGREAFGAFAREWFAETRLRRETFPIVTARERVRLLDDSTAVLVVHWSVPGNTAPYRSLLVYRRTPAGWRIVAEHSSEVPPDDAAAGSPDSGSPRSDSLDG